MIKIIMDNLDIIPVIKKDVKMFNTVESLSEKDTFLYNGAIFEVESIIPYFNMTNRLHKIETSLDSFYVPTNHAIISKTYKSIDNERLFDFNFPQNLKIEDFICKTTQTVLDKSLYLPKDILNINNCIPTKYNNNSFDINVKGDAIAKELDLPKWFIVKALTTGVPENEEYNNKLIAYIESKGFKTLDEFKLDIISKYSLRKSPALKIHGGLICLVAYYLLGYFNINENFCSVIIDTTKFESDSLELITGFLNKNDFKFTISGSKFKDFSMITIESLLFTNFVKSNFLDLNWIHDMSWRFKLALDNYLRNFYLVTTSKQSINNLKLFLSSYGTLTTINKIDDKFILDIVDPETFFKYTFTKEEISTYDVNANSSGYFLPIISNEIIKDTSNISVITAKQVSY